MKIEFFGDSFSHEKTTFPRPDYKTYIQLLEKEYDHDIKIHSSGCCSHWDIIINQFMPHMNNLPEVCVFTWPDQYRLYHRHLRNIRLKESLEFSETKWKLFKIDYDFGLRNKIWQAAEMFYTHLFDEQKNDLEYKSALYYFDREILANLKNTKFIHLWSFEKVYDWQNTVELSMPLKQIAMENFPNYDNDEKCLLAPNHLPGQHLNNLVFESVKKLIDT